LNPSATYQPLLLVLLGCGGDVLLGDMVYQGLGYVKSGCVATDSCIRVAGIRSAERILYATEGIASGGRIDIVAA